jgi:glucosamine--fructose-6-phosphate aminotransferase (isomerizing)
MCGIVGHIGKTSSTPVLLDALRRLEYRGYDSAGIVVVDEGVARVRRCLGKLRALESSLYENPISGSVGLGHTRWATHGRPSEDNAHPHTDCRHQVYVIHNGIIENFQEVEAQLAARGHRFASETDTELVAHLIEEYLESGHSFELAASLAARSLRGAYALVVLYAGRPDLIIGVRRRSPLVVGLGDGENFLGSDVPALLPYTRRVLYLGDGQMAFVSRSEARITDLEMRPIEAEVHEVRWDQRSAEKEGFRHYMLKEIFEQPRLLREILNLYTNRRTLLPRVPGVEALDPVLSGVRSFQGVACGTAWHACLMARHYIEELARIPMSVDYASEYRMRQPFAGQDVLCLAISQSGETADTLAAVEVARKAGSRLLSICNVEGSSLTRESDAVVYTHAGPEIGVASTKAFSCQLAVALLLAVELGLRRGHLGEPDARDIVGALEVLPAQMEEVLAEEERYKALAWELHQRPDWLYLGRGALFPIALEGALKLKEISYLHAEGHPAGEMKHGPIALIETGVPVVALVAADAAAEKIVGNIREARARDGLIIGLAPDRSPARPYLDRHLRLPEAHRLTAPLLATVGTQLLAYHVANARGCDVDQPRNLAKSVTVE